MPKDCPRCHLVNPPDAQRCDCGYDFVTGRAEHSYLTPGQVRRAVLASGGGLGAVGAVLLLYQLVGAAWRHLSGAGTVGTQTSLFLIVALGLAVLIVVLYVVLRKRASATLRYITRGLAGFIRRISGGPGSTGVRLFSYMP